MHAYPIRLHDNGTWATARDIPEFNTAGNGDTETIANAVDGLITALSFYQDRSQKMPVASEPQVGEVLIHIPTLEAAKIALWNEMVEQGINKASLARRLGVSATSAGRLASILYSSRIEVVENALLALGKRLSVVTEAS